MCLHAVSYKFANLVKHFPLDSQRICVNSGKLTKFSPSSAHGCWKTRLHFGFRLMWFTIWTTTGMASSRAGLLSTSAINIFKSVNSQRFNSCKRLYSSTINDPLHPLHSCLANALSSSRFSSKPHRCTTSLFGNSLIPSLHANPIFYLPIFRK